MVFWIEFVSLSTSKSSAIFACFSLYEFTKKQALSQMVLAGGSA
jgi:hypothetical protein